MIRYAEGQNAIVYKSIHLLDRPAVDCYRLITADNRTVTILNWGESQKFYWSIQDWMLQLPKSPKVKEKGVCRDEDISEMLRQYVEYKPVFTPPPSESETKAVQREWSQ